MGFSKWYAATGCSDAAGDGARAMMSVLLDRFSRGENWGIFNCRHVRGSDYYSAHAEGRALDIGLPKDSNGHGSDYGYNVVEALIEAGSRLGIMAIIYDRTIWSAKSPNGRRYTGSHPHYDHVHVELTRSAAEKLNKRTVRRVLNDVMDDDNDNDDGNSKYESYKENARPGSRTVGSFQTRPWSAGDDVKELQRILNAWYPHRRDLKLDGYFGPRTKKAVQYLQGRANVRIDGIVGPVTWGVLNVK